MSISQHIQQALINIFSSKLRSFLAVLGILVGTASVVALVSIGELGTKQALDQFKNLGTDLMAINFFEEGGKRSSENEEFGVQHAEGLAKSSEEIKIAAPYSTLYVPNNFQGYRLHSGIIAITEDLKDAIKITVNRGRFISFLDEFNYYCVLGSKVYREIREKTDQNPIGQQIQLGKSFFTIVGVLKHWPENSFFNADINASVLIPIKTAKLLSKYSRINNVVMKLTQNSNIDTVKNAISSYMGNNLPQLKVFYRSAKQIVEGMKNQKRIYTLMLGAIGGIALLVGGIGVMNVMLVSVTERRKEIGIRMTVGARRKDIRTLFLIESIVLALFGGIMGIIFGVVTSFVVAMFSGWTFALFLAPPLLGFIVSFATGVFFGFYPAHRASKLDPIETLRYE